MQTDTTSQNLALIKKDIIKVNKNNALFFFNILVYLISRHLKIHIIIIKKKKAGVFRELALGTCAKIASNAVRHYDSYNKVAY